MLVTFTTNSHADITMFGDVAMEMLKMMGHSGTVPGAILAADVQIALDQLQRAANLHQNDLASPSKDSDETDVSVMNRALPLISLLSSALNNHENVMWKQN